MWFEKLTFGDLIDRAAERWPEREALWFEGRRWSFAEQRDEVDRAAKALIAAGVAPRRPRLPLARQSARARLPLLRRRQDRRRAGADQHALSHPRHGVHRHAVGRDDADLPPTAPHGVDYLAMIEELLPDLRRQQRRGAGGRATPALRRVILLADGRCRARCAGRTLLARGGVGRPTRELARRSAAVDPDGTAYIMYTSGTTGFPKGVMQGHNVIRNVLRQRQPPRRDAERRRSSTTCRSSTPSPSTRRCSCRPPPARATSSCRTSTPARRCA